ncbi:hypothetical protein [Roseibium sp.]|uniref:hypothetical protein n=1 Tax=Roseibium sp. TaxID=1936156 RepID=UPI003B51F442
MKPKNTPGTGRVLGHKVPNDVTIAVNALFHISCLLGATARKNGAKLGEIALQLDRARAEACASLNSHDAVRDLDEFIEVIRQTSESGAYLREANYVDGNRKIKR